MKKIVVIIIFLLIGLFINANNQIDSLLKRAKECHNTNIDSVGINLLMAYNISIKTNDYDNKIKIICELINYAEYKVDFALGDKFFKEGLRLSKEKKDFKSKANLLISLSGLFEKTGFYDQAINGLLDASKILDSLNLKKEMFKVYAMLSHNFRLKKDYNKTFEYALKTLRVSSILNDNNLLAQSNFYVANAFVDLNNSDSAIKYYNKSIHLYEKLNDVYTTASIYNNLGILYQKEGKYTEAEKRFLSAYKIAKQINYFILEVYLESELGDLYRTMKQYDKAEKFFTLALSREKKANYKVLTQTLFFNVHDYYKEVGNTEKSLDYFEKYVTLSDSLNQINSDQRVLETETKFRTKEKQKEIEILNIKSTAQQSQLKKRNLVIGLSGLVIAIVLLLLFFIFKSRKKQIKTNSLLEIKNREIEHQKNEIIDSINYAKRIQTATLGSPERIVELYDNSAIIFQPKDIVSGDFYWFHKIGNKFMFSVADCTGHGVPGAMMSMIGNNGLNDAVSREKGINDPARILEHLSHQVHTNFNKNVTEIKDSMDISFCILNTDTKVLEFAGAINPLIICKNNGEIIEIKGDKQFIGQKDSTYTNHSIQLKTGDCVYIMSDGFVDQFGGLDNKKFKISNLKKLLPNINSHDAQYQAGFLTSAINDWKSSNEQTDDICVMVVKII